MSSESPDYAGFLSQRAFVPEQVQPKAFDFTPYQVRHKDKESKSAKGKRDDESGSGLQEGGNKRKHNDSSKETKEPKEAKESKEYKLPRRVTIHAFSKAVGHRPAGLQVAQTKLYVERFPTEFNIMSLGKCVLPHHKGLPFVSPDGFLPCPLLSTCNALKFLEKRPELLTPEKCDPRALSDIRTVLHGGLQIEWVEVKEFLEWMVESETAAVQQQVRVHPHVVDTCLLYLSFLQSQLAVTYSDPDSSMSALP